MSPRWPNPCPFGSHRAGGELPQPAWRLDNTMEFAANEVLLDVDILNIDSSSMNQIARAADNDPEGMKRQIADIVATRGKMHNPETGSGGVLVGTVRAVGPDFPDSSLAPGERVCVMVSLSLTPLRLDAIAEVDVARCQVAVRGQAILFASGLFARMPDDLPEAFALAVFDIAGAPGTLIKIVQPGQRVAVLGAGGKAGLFCLAAARERLGSQGQLLAVDLNATALADVRRLDLADAVIEADLTHPLDVHRAVGDATDGELADLAVNTANVCGTEVSAILATRQQGQIYYFNMSTSFQTAALSAEGGGRDVQMLIGNGYTEGWVAASLELLRRQPGLKDILVQRYAN